MSFRDRIKRLIKPFHDEMEENRIAKKIFDHTITKNDLFLLLDTFNSLIVPIEQKLILHKDRFVNLGVDLIARLKSNHIKNDIQKLGFEPKKELIDPFNDSSFSSAIGMLYVLEGSSMGGQIIAKELQKLNLPHDYFYPYKENTMQMWTNFIEFLNRCQNEPDFEEERAIISACSLFLYLAKEFKKF